MKTTTLFLFTVFALGLCAIRGAEKSAPDMLPDKLVNAKGEKVSLDSLKGKVLGIYFSAHWCPPCRVFTPELVKFRDKNQKDFEVVFVSLDNSEAEKQAYMGEEKMNWPTIEGIRSSEGNALAQKFSIEGIPSLIIIAPDGRPITAEGRRHVSTDPEGALGMWKKAAGIAEG